MASTDQPAARGYGGEGPAGAPGALAMPRRRGAVIGTALVILGIWGAIIPFIGPYFDYQIGSTATWDWSINRLWLDILPGVAAIFGGLILLGVANRASAALGAWIALAGGIWFAVGTSFSLLWLSSGSAAGVVHGSATMRWLEQIGYFYGLGVVITGLAAYALGIVLTRSERDARILVQDRRPPSAETREPAPPAAETREPPPAQTREPHAPR